MFHTRSLARIPTAVALLALCAWVALPLGEISATLQTCGVALICILLHPVEALTAIALYLGLGFLGVPVFSHGTGGIAILFGPSGGFLLGFFCMGIVISLFGHCFQYKPLPLAIGIVLGSLLQYACGLLWFCFVYMTDTGGISFSAAFAGIVLPFLLPDAVKGTLALLLGLQLRRVMARR